MAMAIPRDSVACQRFFCLCQLFESLKLLLSIQEPCVLCRFQGNEMDLEFIGILQQQCQKYVTEKGVASVQQIQQYIQRAVSFQNVSVSRLSDIIIEQMAYSHVA